MRGRDDEVGGREKMVEEDEEEGRIGRMLQKLSVRKEEGQVEGEGGASERPFVQRVNF